MDIQLSFPCGLRGYHQYRIIWTPTINEVLGVLQEPGNRYDRCAIACSTEQPSNPHADTIVGHLPKELSQFTFYIMNYGARITAKALSTQHRRSPLVQGGLEIPIQVTVRMYNSKKNQLYLEKYKLLVGEKYKEPVDGNFEDATSSILRRLDVQDEDEESESESDE